MEAEVERDSVVSLEDVGSIGSVSGVSGDIAAFACPRKAGRGMSADEVSGFVELEVDDEATGRSGVSSLLDIVEGLNA